MAKEPATKEYKPLTERELTECLLWLFNTTGHRQHVEAWRASKEKPPAKPAAAGDDE